MKVTFSEFDDTFHMDFEPETLEEAATLVRFGMNATKNIENLSTVAMTKALSANLVISKSKRTSVVVAKGKW